MKKISILFFVLVISARAETTPVRMSDLTELTFNAHARTTSRVGNTVPQISHEIHSKYFWHDLEYVEKRLPQNIVCVRKDVQRRTVWECAIDLEGHWILQTPVSVSCEGWDNERDTFVVAGSCALKYTVVSQPPFHTLYGVILKILDDRPGLLAISGLAALLMTIVAIPGTLVAIDQQFIITVAIVGKVIRSSYSVLTDRIDTSQYEDVTYIGSEHILADIRKLETSQSLWHLRTNLETIFSKIVPDVVIMCASEEEEEEEEEEELATPGSNEGGAVLNEIHEIV